MKRSWKTMLSAAVAVVTIGLSAAADATTAVLLSREELVHKSMVVVRVTVGRSTTQESEDGTSIVTRTELTVKQLLKGDNLKTIVIEQIGGTFNGKTQRLLGDAILTQGEDAVVFLRPSDKGGRWNFTALALSVYHVDTAGLARRSLDGLSLVKRNAGALVPMPRISEEAEPIESLMTDVVRIARAK